MGRWNYFIDELGVAIIEPNVRGSTGYGKTFVALDNGMKREDSVKDIGALFDWIATQPDLDASRVLVEGGSYGGYMVLAVATNLRRPDRRHDRRRRRRELRVVPREHRELSPRSAPRRVRRRARSRDARIPDADLAGEQRERIKAPLFVVHGRNDPRVPYTEAEQIVAAARKNGVPVWYLLADNEGHGYARKANVDYLFYAMIEFIRARGLST